MLGDIHKKCFICKRLMVLGKDDIVYKSGNYIHFDCLVKDKFNKKRNKLSIKEIENEVREIQKKNDCHIQERILSEEFYQWISQSYGIVAIPTLFFVKIDSVLKGKYKGLTIGIPLNDLFDMWKRKKNELDKIYMNNVKKGKSMDTGLRLNYDLAILVGKYDSYLKWKCNEKLLADQQVQSITENKIDIDKINKIVSSNQENNSENINDILDEVF